MDVQDVGAPRGRALKGTMQCSAIGLDAACSVCETRAVALAVLACPLEILQYLHRTQKTH